MCVQNVGKGSNKIVHQTSKEQTQETSTCVALLWVPLHFGNTQLLQSTNTMSIMVPCCIDFRSWIRAVNLRLEETEITISSETGMYYLEL